jgi:hypothetical protein
MKPDSESYISSPGLDTIDSRKNPSLVNRISMEYSTSNMDRKSDRKLVSFRLPEDLMQELRARAESDNISVTELVYRLLKQGLHASVDDRIAALETEIRELRKLKQVNLSSISPAPVYTLLPHGGYPSEGDIEMKRRVAELETRMEEIATSFKHMGALPSYLAKLDILIEEVQSSRRTAPNQSVHSEDEALCEGVERRSSDLTTTQSAYQKKKPSSESGRSSEEVA